MALTHLFRASMVVVITMVLAVALLKTRSLMVQLPFLRTCLSQVLMPTELLVPFTTISSLLVTQGFLTE